MVVESGEFSANTARLTACRAGDIVAGGEKGGLNFLFSGIRPGLLEYATQLPGSRVLEDRYGVNAIAIAVAKGRGGWLSYVSEFIEESKTFGLVQQAIVHAGLRGVHVVPPKNPNCGA